MGEFKINTNQAIDLINQAAVKGAITFKGGAYKARNANGDIENISFPTLRLPEASTLAIEVQKSIIETPLNGGRGSFKEIVQIGEYEITIIGTLLAQNYEQANTEIQRINDLFKVNRSLNIINDYLQSLGINQVVLRAFSLPDLQGGEYQRSYQITCVSDNNPEIQNLNL
jgi:hypothetical protein